MGEIMERFPQYEYGIRPHPGEHIAAYLEIFKDKLIPVENMVAPIAVCWADIIIHPGSTMAYEAHLMNKPTFNFRNTNLDVVVGNIAPLSNTVEELINHLDKVEVDKSNANPTIIKDLEKYYGKVDGNAYKRAAKKILSISCGETKIPDMWPKNELLYPTQGVYTDLLEWTCTVCDGKFYSQRMRFTVKCPYCGIGCIQRKYNIYKDKDGNETRVPVH